MTCWNHDLLQRWALSRRGQMDLNAGSPSLAVVCGNVASMLLDDPVANAQPQTRAFAHALGRVEGIENPVRFFDARPGVLKFNIHFTAAGVHGDSEQSALPHLQHGVHRIVDDIEKNLFQLMRGRPPPPRTSSSLLPRT